MEWCFWMSLGALAKEIMRRSPPHETQIKKLPRAGRTIVVPVADTKSISMRLSVALVCNYLRQTGFGATTLGCWAPSEVAVSNTEHVRIHRMSKFCPPSQLEKGIKMWCVGGRAPHFLQPSGWCKADNHFPPHFLRGGGEGGAYSPNYQVMLAVFCGAPIPYQQTCWRYSKRYLIRELLCHT